MFAISTVKADGDCGWRVVRQQMDGGPQEEMHKFSGEEVLAST